MHKKKMLVNGITRRLLRKVTDAHQPAYIHTYNT